MFVSSYLVAAAVAWAIAQFVKYIVTAAKSGRWLDTSSVLHSGNMPSVHTATAVSLTIAIGAGEGSQSAIFALSFLMMAIVAYDAMGVRRTAGEQGKILLTLLKKSDKKPYVALGHTPLEVTVGAFIGIAVGMLVALFTPTFL